MKDEFITRVGVWGQRHYNYLKKHFTTVINVMRMNGTLEQYMLRFALSQYNAPEYFENGIPESVIDAYVEKIVVFEDHFEWYLRFGGNDPLKCHVNGKEDANPEVIFGDSSSSLTELEKHRLRLRIKRNNRLFDNLPHIY